MTSATSISTSKVLSLQDFFSNSKFILGLKAKLAPFLLMHCHQIQILMPEGTITII